MDLSFVQDPQFFSLVVLPLLIFTARVADVTFGTLRIIFVSRGLRLLAPLVGFVEILIWLVAISQIFQNLGSIVNYVAYAAGFAVGSYVGIIVEGRMAIGLMLVRIITHHNPEDLIASLKSNNFGVTVVDAVGKHGPVRLIFLVIERKDLEAVIGMVHRHNPHAFYTLADVRSANGGVIPHLYRKPHRWLSGRYRKGK
ncbi:DUF2179 domain-containing protein [Methanogenium cariaci]|jgi:uncharacterized protein YebE (UPF0316 family)